MMFTLFLALLAIMAMIPGSSSDHGPDNPLVMRGIGELVDHCDDDWDIIPKQYFVGRCDNGQGSRRAMYIDINNCFTVTDKGDIAVDNWRVGGFANKCDRCARCTDLDKGACVMCRCNHTDPGPGRNWAKIDLDGPLFVDPKRPAICCGEWWGGPYCGPLGKPPVPQEAGLVNYLNGENQH